MTKENTIWWRGTRIRDELLETSGMVANIQMSLSGVAYGVAGKFPAYRSVEYFGEITHPSPSLVRIAADVAMRLGGRGGQAPSAKPVWRFDQGMGGGKSHALVALYHLASDPAGFAKTDLGSQVFSEASKMVGSGAIDPHLGDPIVVVLPGDQMDPDRPDPEVFGGALTLWERFLFRLYEGDHERWVADKDSISYTEALQRVGRPVLILFDEVMHYVRAVTRSGPTERALEDQAFLVKIMRDTNEVDNCVAVMVMIDSTKDPIALSEFGEKCRRELEEEADRGEVRGDAVTSPSDFASIIRRRLFSELPSSKEISATAARFEEAARDAAWNKEIFAKMRGLGDGDFASLVNRSYPFHPALIHLAEQEWSQIAGFQRVRSTIRVFAATVYAHLRRIAESNGITVEELQSDPTRATDAVWVPELIGPGDIVLSDPDVREALLDSGLIVDNKTAQNYRQVIATDIVDESDASGNARHIDIESAQNPSRSVNPRAAERIATATLLYSLTDRPQGGQGASVPEALAAAFVPDLAFGYGDAEVVLEALKDPLGGLASLEWIPGKGGQPARLYLSTKKTYGMFFRDALNAVTEADRDAVLAERARSLALSSSGPFDTVIFVERPTETASALETIKAASFDQPRKNRLIVLDPRVFSLLNGADDDTRAAIKAAMGLGADRLPVNWASSAVFAVVNTYRRRTAQIAAREFLAAQRVAAREAVRADPDLKAQVQEDVEQKSREFDKQLRAAFQHVVWLADLGNGERGWGEHRFDGDLESALNGSHVWKVLQLHEKAFGVGEFTSTALLHNLRDGDFGKPLSELRDDFWRLPRLALLPGGESDLRSALWSALQKGDVYIAGSDGQVREAKYAGEINLASDGLRLMRQLDEAEDVPDGGDVSEQHEEILVDTSPVRSREKQVSVSGTLVVKPENRDLLRLALDSLKNAIDDGDVSWLQLSIKTTVSEDRAEEIASRSHDAGLTSHTQDL